MPADNDTANADQLAYYACECPHCGAVACVKYSYTCTGRGSSRSIDEKNAALRLQRNLPLYRQSQDRRQVHDPAEGF